MERRSRFEILFNAVGDAMLVADDERRYIDANAAATTLLGLEREEIVGRRIDDFADLKGDVDALWQRFLLEGRLDGNFDLRRSDGERREVEFRAIAHVAPGEHLSVIRDVTEQRRAQAVAADMRERALHAEAIEAGLRLSGDILRQIPDGVVVADVNGTILRWAGAAERIFGYTSDEALGRNASLLQPAKERERVGAAILTALRDTGSFTGEVPAERIGRQHVSRGARCPPASRCARHGDRLHRRQSRSVRAQSGKSGARGGRKGRPIPTPFHGHPRPRPAQSPRGDHERCSVDRAIGSRREGDALSSPDSR